MGQRAKGQKNEHIPLNPNMSHMQPITADTLRGLKAKKDEDIRRFQIQTLTKIIYEEAVAVASTTIRTSYEHPACYEPRNSEEIITALRDLFPDCRVSMKKFIQTLGVPVQLIEVDNLRIFADKSAHDYIVVDWSL